jgi:hypothetical protein
MLVRQMSQLASVSIPQSAIFCQSRYLAFNAAALVRLLYICSASVSALLCLLYGRSAVVLIPLSAPRLTEDCFSFSFVDNGACGLLLRTERDPTGNADQEHRAIIEHHS